MFIFENQILKIIYVCQFGFWEVGIFVTLVFIETFLPGALSINIIFMFVPTLENIFCFSAVLTCQTVGNIGGRKHCNCGFPGDNRSQLDWLEKVDQITRRQRQMS